MDLNKRILLFGVLIQFLLCEVHLVPSDDVNATKDGTKRGGPGSILGNLLHSVGEPNKDAGRSIIPTNVHSSTSAQPLITSQPISMNLTTDDVSSNGTKSDNDESQVIENANHTQESMINIVNNTQDEIVGSNLVNNTIAVEDLIASTNADGITGLDSLTGFGNDSSLGRNISDNNNNQTGETGENAERNQRLPGMMAISSTPSPLEGARVPPSLTPVISRDKGSIGFSSTANPLNKSLIPTFYPNQQSLSSQVTATSAPSIGNTATRRTPETTQFPLSRRKTTRYTPNNTDTADARTIRPIVLPTTRLSPTTTTATMLKPHTKLRPSKLNKHQASSPAKEAQQPLGALDSGRDDIAGMDPLALGIGICIPVLLIFVVILSVFCYRKYKKGGRGYITLDDFGTFEGMQNPNYDGEL